MKRVGPSPSYRSLFATLPLQVRIMKEKLNSSEKMARVIMDRCRVKEIERDQDKLVWHRQAKSEKRRTSASMCLKD